MLGNCFSNQNVISIFESVPAEKQSNQKDIIKAKSNKVVKLVKETQLQNKVETTSSKKLNSNSISQIADSNSSNNLKATTISSGNLKVITNSRKPS